MDKHPEQNERGRVQQEPKFLSRCPRSGLVGQDHRAGGFLLPLARLFEQRLQHEVSRRKEVAKQLPMRQQRVDRVGVTNWKRLRGELVQSIGYLARRRGRGVERQLQDGRCKRADRRRKRAIPVRSGKMGVKQAEVSEGVLQQSILALELLGQLLLSADRRGKPIDGRRLFRISRNGIAQPTYQFRQSVYFPHQRIVVAQHSGTRAENIALECAFHQSEAVECPKGTIKPFCLRIASPERQPGEQYEHERQSRRGSDSLYG